MNKTVGGRVNKIKKSGSFKVDPDEDVFENAVQTPSYDDEDGNHYDSYGQPGSFDGEEDEVC